LGWVGRAKEVDMVKGLESALLEAVGTLLAKVAKVFGEQP
jgi:hypothetical protein